MLLTCNNRAAARKDWPWQYPISGSYTEYAYKDRNISKFQMLLQTQF